MPSLPVVYQRVYKRDALSHLGHKFLFTLLALCHVMAAQFLTMDSLCWSLREFEHLRA